MDAGPFFDALTPRCHPCESREPRTQRIEWIPAFAGMTDNIAFDSESNEHYNTSRTKSI